MKRFQLFGGAKIGARTKSRRRKGEGRGEKGTVIPSYQNGWILHERVFSPSQVTTRVYLVWAYHTTEDASNPNMFGKHSHRNHTMEALQIVFTGMDMLSTPPQPTAGVTTRPPSSGLQLCISFLSISVASILSILVNWRNLDFIAPLRADFNRFVCIW